MMLLKCVNCMAENASAKKKGEALFDETSLLADILWEGTSYCYDHFIEMLRIRETTKKRLKKMSDEQIIDIL